jgi:stage 0 sporulation protein B (sporulation initiation phosphotransferase)
MYRGKFQVLSLMIILVSLFVLIFHPLFIWRAFFAVVLVAAGMYLLRDSRKNVEITIYTAGLKEKENTVRRLNRYRHDWMNDLQVLFGYIQMKKYEKLPLFVDKIKRKMSSESQIYNLGDPALSLLIADFCEQNDTYVFELNSTEAVVIRKLPVNDRLLQDLIFHLLSIFQQSSLGEDRQSNRLQLSFEALERSLCVHFHYTGNYEEKKLAEAANDVFSAQANRHMLKYNVDIEENEAAVSIEMPFLT